MDNIINKIREDLENNIDKRTQETSQNFFKERIKFYGVKSAIVGKIRKKTIMPRTALRYAIEKMPEEMKKKAMGK